MQFIEDFPALPMDEFQSHYILVFFFFTSLQVAAEQLHYQVLSEESLRLEILFRFLLQQLTELTNLENSLKVFNFLNFWVSIKNL